MEELVPLHVYARRIEYAETAFWGIYHEDDARYACRDIWTLEQRMTMQAQLQHAQGELRDALGYNPVPDWQEERHRYRREIRLEEGYVRAFGQLAEVVVAEDAVPDYTADPAVITVPYADWPAAARFEAPYSPYVRLYLPGTDTRIYAESVTFDEDADEVRISLPHARLVAEDYRANPLEGWQYTDAAWRAPEVTVVAVYTDDSEHGYLDGLRCGRPPRVSLGDIQGDILNERLGMVRIYHDCLTWGSQLQATLYTYSGMDRATASMDAGIRLAHALLPDEPCGCDAIQRMWRRDRQTPEILTADRLNCPFGASDGAWYVWRWAQHNRVHRARTA